MAEIVNLNQFRKARQKADKDTQAARNRVRHGRRKMTVSAVTGKKTAAGGTWMAAI